MAGLTAALGTFLENITYDQLPSEALQLVRDAFTDTVAVMMAGTAEPIVGIARRHAIAPGATGEARLCLSGHDTWAPAAALVGGTAAHALDFDDQSLTGHPSAVLVPAILAEAEALGSTGKDMVTAYVAGYEVWAEVIRRNANYHSKGWHPTSVFGVLGAAAAAAVLRRLSGRQCATALGIAASYASGLGSNFGTMTKPYHAGIAASNGLVSARMAAGGASAALDALESPRGFLVAFSPGTEPDLTSEPLVGQKWSLPWQRLCVKKYPTCYFTHRSFDATVKMLAGREIRPEDVARVEVTMGKGQTTVLANTRPANALEAKFSAQFTMAAAVLLGRMGVTEVVDEVVQRQDIRDFFPKVHLNPVDASDPRDPAHSPTESVRIELVSGEVLESGPIRSVRGHAEDPLSTEELWEKFEACTAKTHSPNDARHLFGVLQGVESLAGARDIPTVRGLFDH